jgi:hypothetical protein
MKTGNNYSAEEKSERKNAFTVTPGPEIPLLKRAAVLVWK